MSDIDIDIDVDGASRVGPALRRGLKEGLDEAGRELLDKGDDKARDIVMLTDRVWRQTVKQGFREDVNQFNRYYRWQGKLENEAPHAGIVESGLRPGSSPSVQDIIPWVSDKLTPNASAQARADSADVGNWDPQLQALAGEYSPGMVITAFAVKEGLEEDGYPGIGFMETTEAYLNQIGPMLVHRKVEKQMNKELRAAGLK